jgi:hypothetical protein
MLEALDAKAGLNEICTLHFSFFLPQRSPSCKHPWLKTTTQQSLLSSNLSASCPYARPAGSTYAIEQQRHPPEMTLIADVTVDNKEYMAPGTPFRQTWRIRNPGIGIGLPGDMKDSRAGCMLFCSLFLFFFSFSFFS